MNILEVFGGTVVGFNVVQEGQFNVGLAQVQVPTKRTNQDGSVVNNFVLLRVTRQNDLQFFQSITGPTPINFIADHFVIENQNGMVVVKASLLHATIGAPNSNPETMVTVTNGKTGTFPVQQKTTNSGKTAVTVSLSSFGETVNNQTVWNSFQLTGFNKQECDLLSNIAPSTYVTVHVGQCVFTASPKKQNPICYGVIRGIEAQEGRNLLKVDPQNGSTTQQNNAGGFGGNGFGAPQQNGFGAPQNSFGGQAPAQQGNGFGQPAQTAPAQQGNGFGSQPPMQQSSNNVGGFGDEDIPF